MHISISQLPRARGLYSLTILTLVSLMQACDGDSIASSYELDEFGRPIEIIIDFNPSEPEPEPEPELPPVDPTPEVPIIIDQAPHAPCALEHCIVDTSYENVPFWNLDYNTLTQNIISSTEEGAYTVFTIDFDADGDMDIINGAWVSGTVSLFLNKGVFPLEFEQYVLARDLRGVISMQPADFDGDGDWDISLAVADRFIWLENQGGFSFKQHTLNDQRTSAVSVFNTDLDGDGDTDILSASLRDSTLSWFENTGTFDVEIVLRPDGVNTEEQLILIFNEHIISMDAFFIHSINAADLDNDGDIDITAALATEDKILWFENDGSFSPNFHEHVLNDEAEGASSTYIADLDADHDLDIIATSLGDDTLEWYENDGTANFTLHTISNSTHRASNSYAKDIDQDGDMDIITSSQGENTITWYENDGQEQPLFLPRVIENADISVRDLAFADLNLDGDLEIIAASYNDNALSWYDTTQRHYSLVEGDSLVALELASDPNDDSLSYAILPSADARWFVIDNMTGELNFKSPPSFFIPQDLNQDNIYEITLEASDGTSQITLILAIEVKKLLDIQNKLRLKRQSKIKWIER